MGRVYHTKLKTPSKKVREAFKRMAGVYRAMFNLSMEAQWRRIVVGAHPSQVELHPDFLLEVIKLGEKKNYPFIRDVDGGITRRAVNNANYSFKRWYNYERWHQAKGIIVPHYLARKRGMNFSTATNIKVFYDHISIPKLGDVKLFEKGYIPQGKRYKNVSFSYDGRNWWLSVEACEAEEVVKDFLTTSLKVDVGSNGNLYVGDKIYSCIVDSENFKAQKAKRAKLARKLKRQKEANTLYSKAGKKVIRTSRNMMKTRNQIQRVSAKMTEIRKDYHRKVVNEVARTKPKELQLLSLYDAKYIRQNYLSRRMREAGTRELLGMLKRKLEAQGSAIKRYSFLAELPPWVPGSTIEEAPVRHMPNKSLVFVGTAKRRGQQKRK